jgi:MFS family permease
MPSHCSFTNPLSGHQKQQSRLAFRALQRLGAGIGIVLAFVLVAGMFPPAERVKWQSLFGVEYGSIPQELAGCT